MNDYESGPPGPGEGRRTLTHVGGPTKTFGRAELAGPLAHAFDVPRSDQEPVRRGPGLEAPPPPRRPLEDDPARPHVHGFHAWPARMHPQTARRLIEAFSPVGGRVLDPFSGSGTVPLEALLAGRDAFANDLNPLAVKLLQLKADGNFDGAKVLEDAEKIRDFADERRKKKAGASQRFPDEDVAAFAPHVLLTLDSLRLGIETIAREETARPLFLVLSSMLVKFSNRRGDAADKTLEKRFAADFPSRFFYAKTDELVRRHGEYHALLAGAPKRGRLFTYEEDAAALKRIRDGEIDLVVTSPPYAATYDYADQHALRLRWLGLDGRAFAGGEMGARRNYQGLRGEDMIARWEGELARLLDGLARVVRPGGYLALVLGDSAMGRHVLRGDEFIARVAAGGPFTLLARASQERPHFHTATAPLFGTRPRAEHVILLERSATVAARPSPAAEPRRTDGPRRPFEGARRPDDRRARPAPEGPRPPRRAAGGEPPPPRAPRTDARPPRDEAPRRRIVTLPGLEPTPPKATRKKKSS